MVVPSVSIRGCESVLGISAIRSTDVDYSLSNEVALNMYQ